MGDIVRGIQASMSRFWRQGTIKSAAFSLYWSADRRWDIQAVSLTVCQKVNSCVQRSHLLLGQIRPVKEITILVQPYSPFLLFFSLQKFIGDKTGYVVTFAAPCPHHEGR